MDSIVDELVAGGVCDGCGTKGAKSKDMPLATKLFCIIDRICYEYKQGDRFELIKYANAAAAAAADDSYCDNCNYHLLHNDNDK